MQQDRGKRSFVFWRRRSTMAWGSLLDEQEILLAALSLQTPHAARVMLFQHLRAPSELPDAAARDAWLVQVLRGSGEHLPGHLRTMALALREGRCRQGTLQWQGQADSPALQIEVQLEAAAALGVPPDQVGFDFRLQPGAPDDAQQLVYWSACPRSELQRWQQQARSAGWRLPVVEPEHQAARRAAECLRGDPLEHWAASAQDWQFSRTAERHIPDGDWEQLQASPLWGPLVACGAALGALL